MPRDLSTFPLSQSAKLKLSNCGFITADDLKDFKPSELSKGSINYQVAHIHILLIL